MALLKDGEDDDDEKEDALARAGSGPNESKKRAPIAKVPPYGADELRAVIIRRKKEQAEKDRAEKLRQEAYEASLDVKIYADELEQSKKRKDGANPFLYDDSLENSAIGVAEFKFSANERPLRMVIPFHFPVVGSVWFGFVAAARTCFLSSTATC